MTFMKKIMDLLNMDNWKSNISNMYNSQNPDEIVNLYSIRSFWKLHPQIYQNNFQESTNEEYLLYGKTLMLWRFSCASQLKSSFPVYFARECHISNPKKLQLQLLQEKYLEPASVKQILSSYKMRDLKIIADSIGCPKSGKKIDLIERILSHLDEETMNTIRAKSNLYVLSDKGRSFLQSNFDYVDLHRHANYNISLYEFNRNRFPDKRRRTFKDNVYTLISQRIYKNCVHHYYHMMEYDYKVLYEIALSEHLYDIALESYLKSLYLRSCCLYIAQYYSSDFYHVESNFTHEIIFTVHSASPLAEIGKFYDSSFVDNIFNDLSLPPSFMCKEEFKNMVDEMIESTAFDYNKYNQIITSRLKEYSKLQ